MKFYIEFKEAGSKRIFCKEIKAENPAEAKELFNKDHADSKILVFEGRQ